MEWLITAFNKMLAFLYSCVLTIIEAFYDMFCLIADILLKVVSSLVSSALSAFSAIPIPSSVPLPSGVAWVASQCGVPQILLIITGALVIRVGLQLIPFVRLGS